MTDNLKFNPKLLTIPQQISIIPHIRAGHYDVRYDINSDLTSLIMNFKIDKDIDVNQLDNIDYDNLKIKVIEHNLIGLIIYGAEIDDKIISIYKYTDVDKKIKEVCISLLSNYFKDNKEIDKYCKKTPNYKIYENVIP